jgi:hypothetical protein
MVASTQGLVAMRQASPPSMTTPRILSRIGSATGE